MNRRNFLKVSAVSASSAMFFREAAAALPSDKKIRLAVVGGGFGSAYFWHLHPNCTVTAVTDLREERQKHLRETYRCDKSFPSMENMLETSADSFDAVAVFTGAPDHVRHAKLCFEKGKHVISAVPAAMKLDECEALRDAVEKSGKHYMMAETSYYRPSCIAARNWFQAGDFGNIYYSESEYFHPRSPNYPKRDNRPDAWRWGLPPMLYPTHCTGFLVGVTKERLVEVTCLGWSNGDTNLEGNPYNNPFLNETALFKTNLGNAHRVAVHWVGPLEFVERAQWYGEKLSFYDLNGGLHGYRKRRMRTDKTTDPNGFNYHQSPLEDWKAERFEKDLPQSLEPGFGKHHAGAEAFLTHEFIAALLEDRSPTVDVYEALAMTVPGIVAHESALQGGKQLTVPVFDRK